MLERGTRGSLAHLLHASRLTAYHQSNINTKGNTPMNTVITTPSRNLYVGTLALDETAPRLMPGDVLHIEATLTVRSVESGLDYRDEPTETVTARPVKGEGPQVVIRTANLIVGEPIEGLPADPEQPKPNRRQRLGAWLLRTADSAPMTYVLLTLAILLIVVSLTGCNMVGYAKPGEPCTTVGSSNVTKSGAPLLCKPATKANVDMGDSTPRWRKA